jgi:DNA-binding MurR/RpiR family transcriptional regulator
MKPAQLTQTISDTLPALRKSERKVADFVLKSPLNDPHAYRRFGPTGFSE